MIEIVCTERAQHLTGDDSAIFRTFGPRIQADYAREDRSDAATMLACVDARNDREKAVAVDLSRSSATAGALPVS